MSGSPVPAKKDKAAIIAAGSWCCYAAFGNEEGESGICHIAMRRINRQQIFIGEEDFERFCR